MKKAALCFLMGTVFLPLCFSQNMPIISGDYNIYKPDFWTVGAGFNIKLFKEIIQNDLSVNFGSMTARRIEIIETKIDDENGEEQIISTEVIDYPQKFLFSIKDNIYFTLEGKFIGIRAGASASIGIYGIKLPGQYDLFFNIGGLAGLSLFSKALISVTLDVLPGYAVAFRILDGVSKNEDGFALAVSVGIRLNFDKL